MYQGQHYHLFEVLRKDNVPRSGTLSPPGVNPLRFIFPLFNYFRHLSSVCFIGGNETHVCKHTRTFATLGFDFGPPSSISFPSSREKLLRVRSRTLHQILLTTIFRILRYRGTRKRSEAKNHMREHMRTFTAKTRELSASQLLQRGIGSQSGSRSAARHLTGEF